MLPCGPGLPIYTATLQSGLGFSMNPSKAPAAVKCRRGSQATHVCRAGLAGWLTVPSGHFKTHAHTEARRAGPEPTITGRSTTLVRCMNACRIAV